MSMLQECDLCLRTVNPEEEPDGIAKCKECDRELCVDCLERLFVKYGASASDVEQILNRDGINGFFMPFEGEWYCPDCYASVTDETV